MASSRPLFLYSTILIHLIAITIAQPNFFLQSCSNDVRNYTSNSTYKTNPDTLLSSISSNNDIDYVFYNLSSGGQGHNEEVNAIVLCRGDVNLNPEYIVVILDIIGIRSLLNNASFAILDGSWSIIIHQLDCL
ncbi:Stress-antifung domain-containing protein [Cephalotus follicularis]|uniref:Stress-antifung domain-containing protein n=1 Tax=Cephalotus follicularis TaxID=3775 RepID=A0A1Q3CKU8_CEPFO|nr:Stress-antifung domain-containing protein [Cephalotus follicularis]